MPTYSRSYYETQIGRTVALHYPPKGNSKKFTARQGFLAEARDGILVIRLLGDAYPTHIDVGADQPAFADPKGMWWKFVSPHRPHGG